MTDPDSDRDDDPDPVSDDADSSQVPAPSGGRSLARSGEDGAGSLMRLRDVQALNRSFRRLAEVQEGLLQQLAALEAERREPARGLLPWLGAALGGGAFVIALAVLALVWSERGKEAPTIEVQSPDVVVNPAPVEISVPEDRIAIEALSELRTQIAALRADKDQDRELMRLLTDHLIQRDTAALAALENLARSPGAPPAAPDGPGEEEAGGGAAPVEPTAEELALAEEQVWLAVVNGLLGMDGHAHLRFEKGERVDGAPELREVVLLEWNEEGLLDNLLKAGSVQCELHQMTGTLVLRFTDGYRSKGGLRVALPPEGVRMNLGEVNVKAWLEHFPELALAGGEPVLSAETEAARPELEQVQASLDDLLAIKGIYGYYRLASLGDVDGDVLRFVQIQHYEGDGRLVKTYEADTMEVRLHPSGTVELLLRNGAFVEGDLRRPFYEDRFRLFLPRQPLDEWRQSGVPFREEES